MDRFWLTDEQFAKIAPHLPTDTRGKQRVDVLFNNPPEVIESFSCVPLQDLPHALIALVSQNVWPEGSLRNCSSHPA
jgi:hypothetical protein